MPVVAEIVSQPCAQDLIDLKKTYEDRTEWLQTAVAGSDLVVAGRFNDRLVSGFLLKDQGDHWQLEKLQVREITRRRGVARQTIHSALKTLDFTRPIRVDLSDHPELASLFAEFGFEESGSGTYQWRP
ncbi:putative GNAT family N-acyltransferase [Litorivivens lipolytica]|uniref:Putative GNAT family N-acyltransferase n=1 Tax=Litorivivens lipolytica TaxID=1524264 RepID=A0A7W4W547_9GAMM|nr:acetyl-CoA sensor PanZ family protein [Litorivivens lipolytica]MBB3047617.1 putative GNAT family N-acyltransferase [Litorivivens lipolytica]